MNSELRNLRRKFVAIVMAVVTGVLAIVFTTIVVLDRNSGESDVYQALEESVMRGEIQQHDPMADYQPGLAGTDVDSEIRHHGGFRGLDGRMDGGGPRGFEIGGRDQGRLFIPVAVYEASPDGELSLAAGSATGEMSEDVLEAASEKLRPLPDGRGFIDSLGVYYVKATHDDATYVAFADEGSNAGWRSLALVLAGVGIAALVVFFLVSLALSKWALRPVAEAWRKQQQFVADASHELKTPLTVMAADVSIMKGHSDRTVASQSKWVESMETEIGGMQELVGDMLLLASGDALCDRGAGDFVPVDLSKIVNSLMLQFESLAYERGMDIEASVEEGVEVRGDRERLKRLVSTLLDNAFKYAGEGGSIKVGLASDRGEARLTVSNSGAPIPEEDLPHIFDRFYRVDKARGRDSGRSYGLGLAIASEVARSHGGSLGAESDREKGTTFTAILPL